MNIGDKVNSFTLITYNQQTRTWLAECTCGNKINTRLSRLKEREMCVKCRPKTKFRHYKPGELVNGNLLIKRRSDRKWICKCKCGSERVCSPTDLKRYATCKNCYDAKVIGKAKRLPDNKALYNTRLKYYQYHAKSRGLIWELTDEEFFLLITSPCHYCGITSSMEEKREDRSIEINGVDRLDNGVGYTISNSLSCCNFCNHAKKNHSVDFFLEQIKRIYEYKFNDYPLGE